MPFAAWGELVTIVRVVGPVPAVYAAATPRPHRELRQGAAVERDPGKVAAVTYRHRSGLSTRRQNRKTR
jgi:hypothetical protein